MGSKHHRHAACNVSQLAEAKFDKDAVALLSGVTVVAIFVVDQRIVPARVAPAGTGCTIPVNHRSGVLLTFQHRKWDRFLPHLALPFHQHGTDSLVQSRETHRHDTPRHLSEQQFEREGGMNESTPIGPLHPDETAGKDERQCALPHWQGEEQADRQDGTHGECH